MVGSILVLAVSVMLGMVLGVIVLVAWAVRREDAHLSLADRTPNLLVWSVRRLLGIHLRGIASSKASSEERVGESQTTDGAYSQRTKDDP